MSRRVALVVTTTATEPGDLLAARLRGLLDAGWDARLLCKGELWTGHPALADPALFGRVERATPRRRHRPPPSLLRRPSRLVRYLRAPGEPGPFDGRLLAWRPDLVHFHSGAAALKGLRLKRVLGCRVVVGFREDGADLDNPGLERVWDEADAVLLSNSGTHHRALALGCPPERAELLAPPAWTAGPARGPAPPRNGRFRVLSVGSLTWEHGFEHSLHAVRMLLDMGCDCEYRIVGRGDHLEAVAFARYQLGLGDRVQLLDPERTSGLVDEMRAADAVVDPAVTDTTSSAAILTAQALGVPFVATARPDLPADAGIAVRRRDPRAIADALTSLAADPDLRARMGAAGQARRRGATPIEDHVRRLEGVYERALA